MTLLPPEDGVVVKVSAVGSAVPLDVRTPNACPSAAAAVVVVAAQILTTASLAEATPPESGCASSNRVLVVEDLLDMGYVLPGEIDDVSNGGNGDGIVCGKPLNPVVQESVCPASQCPVAIVYQFRDNGRTR